MVWSMRMAAQYRLPLRRERRNDRRAMRADGERTLSEHASKALLAGYGVPVAREALVADAEAAACAAAEIGFPVVVKLCGDTVAHKTERSLVRPAASRTRQRLLRSRIVCFDAPARGGLRRG